MVLRAIRYYQRCEKINIDAQRKSALFGWQTAAPVRSSQRHRDAVDLESQMIRKAGSELAHVRIALRLRGDAVAIGVRHMQFTQRRELPKYDDVVHANRATRQFHAAILIYREIAQQTRDRVGAAGSRNDAGHRCQQSRDNPRLLHQWDPDALFGVWMHMVMKMPHAAIMVMSMGVRCETYRVAFLDASEFPYSD